MFWNEYGGSLSNSPFGIALSEVFRIQDFNSGVINSLELIVRRIKLSEEGDLQFYFDDELSLSLFIVGHFDLQWVLKSSNGTCVSLRDGTVSSTE